ncbi:hypothetical protein EDB85DRAFT_2279736 [Lactarius pseudohatsudake]|nr:hypothetical protein EDB85DRAFT_2279736 [Lactarius pseudohatsudake]
MAVAVAVVRVAVVAATICGSRVADDVGGSLRSVVVEAAGLSGVIVIARSHNSKEMTTKAAVWGDSHGLRRRRDEDDRDHNRDGGDGDDNVNATTVETVAATAMTKGPRAAAAATTKR